MDLIKCPICGEEYSPSYLRCPFCEEEMKPRKTKRRLTSRKQAQSARGAMIAVLIVVLALLGWYLFGGKKPSGDDAQTDTETTQPSVPASNTDPFYEAADPEDGTGQDEPPAEDVDVSNAKLNKSDFTLGYAGEKYTIRLSGTEATPTWSIDNPNVAKIAADGTVTAVANGNTTVRCKVGAKELTCTVRVRGTGKNAAAADAPMIAEPITPVAPVAPTTPTTTAPANETPATTSATVDASQLKMRTNIGAIAKNKDGVYDMTIGLKESYTLSVTGTDAKPAWKSDDTSVAKVDANGKLTPVAKGKTNITATVGEVKLTCTVYVK